jgi:hypothetical protein
MPKRADWSPFVANIKNGLSWGAVTAPGQECLMARCQREPLGHDCSESVGFDEACQMGEPPAIRTDDAEHFLDPKSMTL